jgi:DNA-binding CsgD family transcriptional regulator
MKLSRAEADVFNLYLEGRIAQEIAEILNLRSLEKIN